ncbi:MAG: phosphoribosyltransferase [Candidatus Bathyarchaeia archaeon]
MEYIAPDWEDIYEMCIELTEKIKRSGFSPDVIVGVARGGWIPARLISDFLNNPNVASIRIQFYEEVGKTGLKPVITQPVSTSIKGKKVLAVDDVADTGESLKTLYSHLKEKGAAEIKIATLHVKPKSAFQPDFYMKETSAWIIYPHERFEFIKEFVKKFKNEGRRMDELKDELIKIGLKPSHVDKLVEKCWKDV